MINKETLKLTVKEYLAKNNPDYFLVDINISNDKAIDVFFDSNNGISIQDCVLLTREIKQKFESVIDDYNLQVSSPGLGNPFVVREQYLKNISRKADIILIDGTKLKCKLEAIEENILTISVEKKTKEPNTKKNIIIEEKQELDINKIKTTKLVIAFK